jgi:hypothetical protein
MGLQSFSHPQQILQLYLLLIMNQLPLRGRQLLLEQHLDIFSVAIHLNK